MSRQSFDMSVFDDHDASQPLEVKINLKEGTDYFQVQLDPEGFTNDLSTLELLESSMSDEDSFVVMNDGVNNAILAMPAADDTHLIKYALPVISTMIKIRYTPNGNTGTIKRVEAYGLDI